MACVVRISFNAHIEGVDLFSTYFSITVVEYYGAVYLCLQRLEQLALDVEKATWGKADDVRMTQYPIL